MDWSSVLVAVITSGVLVAVVNLLGSRKDRKQQREFNYVERVERRLATVESKVERLEERDSTFQSAVANAYGCQYENECPVLEFLAHHPLPSKSGHQGGPVPGVRPEPVRGEETDLS